MSDPVARLKAALEGRYAIERELGEGGMATVYLADDLHGLRSVSHNVNIYCRIVESRNTPSTLRTYNYQSCYRSTLTSKRTSRCIDCGFHLRNKYLIIYAARLHQFKTTDTILVHRVKDILVCLSNYFLSVKMITANIDEICILGKR